MAALRPAEMAAGLVDHCRLLGPGDAIHTETVRLYVGGPGESWQRDKVIRIWRARMHKERGLWVEYLGWKMGYRLASVPAGFSQIGKGGMRVSLKGEQPSTNTTD